MYFVAGTMGCGNISLAYVLMKNGYFLGYLLILLGGLLSYYTGMLIVKCAHLTGKNRYEDIALSIYGPKIAKLTSLLMLSCLIGFSFSLIVFSVVGCVYLSLAVATTFFVDKIDVPSKLNNINKLDAFKASSQGLISSSPLIIFAYMYQVFIPCLYEELETRTPK